MARVNLNADLVVKRGKRLYSIESIGDIIVIRTNVFAMAALCRKLFTGAEAKPEPGPFENLLSLFGLTLQWRWGPFRLILIRPDGPTRIARHAFGYHA